MKSIKLILFLIMLVPLCVLAQSATWSVHAVTNGGKALPVSVYLEDGTEIPVVAIFEEGNDHFMDVKGIHNGKKISIKLVLTNDVLIPVKGVTEDGTILRVKAEDENGKILDVKGVSRDGNTINVAAVRGEGKYIALKAISPEGVERSVKGVKFLGENVEMKIGDVKVLAHLKALPTIEVGQVDKKWEVAAVTDDGQKLSLSALSKKGKEYPVRALMPGKYPYLMNVRAQFSLDVFIKIIKTDDGFDVGGIDDYGRPYEIRATAENGDVFEVESGEQKGNVIPIYVAGPNGKKYPVKAISSEGHKFDVKGIKVLKDDADGSIPGVNGNVYYFAHIKALAPAQVEVQ